MLIYFYNYVVNIIIMRISFLLGSLALIGFLGLISKRTLAQGIQFEQTLNWKEIKSKAQKENRYILVDCYATWCGPCKAMEKKIFSNTEVGEYINANFISFRLQMDEAMPENNEIKNRYDDVKNFDSLYHITSYPNLLFFSPTGKLVHQIIGATGDPKYFIELASAALNEKKQYYTLLNSMQNHQKDTVYLSNLLISAIQLADSSTIKTAGKYFTNSLLSENLQSNQVRLVAQIASSEADVEFSFLLRHWNKIKDFHDSKEIVARKLSRLIFAENIDPLFKGTDPIFLKKIKREMNRKYPDLSRILIANVEEIFQDKVRETIFRLYTGYQFGELNREEIISKLKKKFPDYSYDQSQVEVEVQYYNDRGQYSQCESAAEKLLHKYSKNLTSDQINNICWEYIFLRGSSKPALLEALKQMAKLASNTNDPDYIDTYANLFYKSGDLSSALSHQEQAIQLASKPAARPAALTAAKEHIEKMKKQKKRG
jgi:thioredoxin-related protein